MSARGGKREGAGRKAASERRKNVTIRMTELEQQTAKQIGNGDVSKGVREALTHCQASKWASSSEHGIALG